jgi:PDZ domain-containing protein
MIVNQTDPISPAPTLKRFSLVRLTFALLVAAAVIVGSILFTLPLFTLYPGPTPDAADLIKVKAPQIYKSKGSIHITTVRLDEANLLKVLQGWVDPAIDVVPRSAIYPPDQTREEHDAELAAEMDLSQYSASVSALRELGFGLDPDGALVRATLKDSPAAKSLKPGDVIFSVDGKTIATPEELVAAMAGLKVGSRVKFGVRRGQGVQNFELGTIASDEPDLRAIVGVEVLQDFKLPFAIDIDSQNIGGPSAGLVFAVSIVDQLDPDDLTHGKVIAGTGEIDYNGSVKPIGGIEQKIAAAERIKAGVFLAPEQEVKQAQAAVRSKMSVIGIRNLHDAVDALRRIR